MGMKIIDLNLFIYHQFARVLYFLKAVITCDFSFLFILLYLEIRLLIKLYMPYFATCQIVFYSRYGDFHTIDWQRDLARDRLRHKFIVKRSKTAFGKLCSLWDAGSGWACVLMVGLAAGTIAGIIDIGARWMSDLKVRSL